MRFLYETVLYKPLVNVLVFFYEIIPYHDLGLSIILLTVLVRLVLYPFVSHTFRAQKKLAHLQPEIKALQDKHKDNKEEQAKRIMELYRERGVNPFSGCLPVLIQLPLLFALYSVFLNATAKELLDALYTFTPRPELISPIAFGLIDLSKSNIVLAILAGVSQFLQGYLAPNTMSASEGGMQRAVQMQTTYVFPILIAVLSLQFPAALALYWVVLNIFGIIQQELIKRAA